MPTGNGAFDAWPEEPIDALIARSRTQQGKSQEALAAALCEASGNVSADRCYVSRWEKGRRIPTPYWRGHLSAVLGIPLDVLDRAAALAHARRAAAQHADLQHHYPLQASTDSAIAAGPLLSAWSTGFLVSTATPATMPWPVGDDMNRAQFLSLMGATVAGAFAEDAYELLRASETAGPSEETVSILEQTVSGLDETYCSISVPAQQLVRPVGQHLAAARRMLSGQPGAQRQRLYAIASQAATMLGCLAFDLHDPQHARLYLHTAEQAAHEAGHPALAGYAISNRSWHALTLGDPQTGLQLARQAQEVAARSAPAPLQAWLAAMEARVLADLGEVRACKQALDTAAAAVARGRPSGAMLGGITFFAADRFVRYEAICRTQFGEAEAARSLLTEAEVTARPEQLVRRTNIRLEIAATYAQEGDVKQASNIAIQALDLLPLERHVAGVLSKANDLDTHITARWPSDPTVRDFHEHLLTIR